MKILVISDLHIGMAARAKELCPYPEGFNKDDKLVSSFIESIKDYTSNYGNINYVIIPGDITNKSQLTEIQCADTFIRKLSTELRIGIDRFIFVPGNHDVNWSVFEGATTKEERSLRKTQKYDSLTNSRVHNFSDIVSNDLLVAPYLKIWEFGDSVFIGYNSSWHDDAESELHYGAIEQEQLDELDRKLSALHCSSLNKLKFFIAHHHLIQYPNPHPLWKDFSCMQNAQSILRILSKYSYNFVIHGHKHVPYFYSISLNSFPYINLLCAGSYSYEIPTQIAGSVGNVYHIIEFEDTITCKGKIKTKAYDQIRSIWINSKENHGINHIDSFGNRLEQVDLYEQCKLYLEPLITGNFKKEKDLERAIPDLIYLQNFAKKILYESLEKNLNLRYCKAANEEGFFIKQ